MIKFSPIYKVVQVYKGKWISANINAGIDEQLKDKKIGHILEYKLNHLTKPLNSTYRALFATPTLEDGLKALEFYKGGDNNKEVVLLYGLGTSVTHVAKGESTDVRMNDGRFSFYCLPGGFSSCICSSFIPLRIEKTIK